MEEGSYRQINKDGVTVLLVEQNAAMVLAICHRGHVPETGKSKETQTDSMRTKDPCPICYLTRPLCICDSIPRLDLNTRVCLIVHVNELKRSSNTGRLALRALVNSEMRVRGQTRQPLGLGDLLTNRYRTFLFYPTVDAVELDNELVAQERTPIQLLVPDGTWRQANKVHYRHHELKNVQRVKISTPDSSKFHLRAQHRPEGMATLQAIAHALGVIEGDLVKAQLMKLYDAKVERTLIGRGLLRCRDASFEL